MVTSMYYWLCNWTIRPMTWSVIHTRRPWRIEANWMNDWTNIISLLTRSIGGDRCLPIQGGERPPLPMSMGVEHHLVVLLWWNPSLWGTYLLLSTSGKVGDTRFPWPISVIICNYQISGILQTVGSPRFPQKEKVVFSVAAPFTFVAKTSNKAHEIAACDGNSHIQRRQKVLDTSSFVK